MYLPGLLLCVCVEFALPITAQNPNTAPMRLPRHLQTRATQGSKPYIQEFSYKTTILSRYAFTAVSCTMFNWRSAAVPSLFQLQIPAEAFVSNFTMIIAGRVYPSQIKPREKKEKQEKEAEGQSRKEEQAGERDDVETFRATATIPGRNRAVFLLTYEELLQRRRGLYEHVTSVRPLQPVARLSLQVTIVEHSEITHLQVLPLRGGKPDANSNATQMPSTDKPPISTVIQLNKTFCRISFSPNVSQQASISPSGVLGDFVVQYDVARELGIGDVQVLDGHFVHYFAPKDLPVVAKNVIFVIDTSASMMGTKMIQTKQALFTILRDLRPSDRFNFVSFSSRIRVWQAGQLVPVTANSIRDAQRFIFAISPTGGTDINRALQEGSRLLSGHLSNGDVHHNSVSLIIFVTDGRPTVGEVLSARILSNTKSAVREQFCVFTIGMGDDVDYRLLERLSLDNCGTMRRIPEHANARSMLKGFYDEIGTPLLSDIRMEYAEDSVEYVTRHHFTTYFNGSEIVIAGKLTNQSADSLHVQVTASNSERSVVMQTDVPVRERELEAGQRVAASGLGTTGDGYMERVWGYISVKDELKTRLRSQGSRDREEATEKATNLSLAFNFLTPVTNMVMEEPEIQVEGGLQENITDGVEEPAGDKEQDGKSPAQGKPVKMPASQQIRISKTSADGDPHFVVDFPLSKLTMCFNINGEPGQVLRLVSDHKSSGVTVNGKLTGAPAPTGSHKRQRTYFSTIAVMTERPRHAYVEITPHKVVLDDDRDRLVLSTNDTISVENDGLAVSVMGRSNVTVIIQETIGFVIMIHRYENPAPFQTDHLGFYISNSKGLSRGCHGLLGQFLNQEARLVRLLTNATVLKNMTNSFPHKLVQMTNVTNNITGPHNKDMLQHNVSLLTQAAENAQLRGETKVLRAPPWRNSSSPSTQLNTLRITEKPHISNSTATAQSNVASKPKELQANRRRTRSVSPPQPNITKPVQIPTEAKLTINAQPDNSASGQRILLANISTVGHMLINITQPDKSQTNASQHSTKTQGLTKTSPVKPSTKNIVAKAIKSTNRGVEQSVQPKVLQQTPRVLTKAKLETSRTTTKPPQTVEQSKDPTSHLTQPRPTAPPQRSQNTTESITLCRNATANTTDCQLHNGTMASRGSSQLSAFALRVNNRTMAVSKKWRSLYGGTERAECWFVRNSAVKLIDGHYQDYVVPHISDTSDGTCWRDNQ